MKFHDIARVFLGLSLLGLLGGCAGYELGATKPESYEGITKIWIPTFENETLEPRLAVMVTNAVISKIQQDGTYKVTNKENADAALRGTIREVIRRQQRSTQTNILRTRELAITLDISYYMEDLITGQKVKTADVYGVDKNARDAATGERRQEGRVFGRASIFLDPNFQLSEREAFPLAAEDAAKQIVIAISEGW